VLVTAAAVAAVAGAAPAPVAARRGAAEPAAPSGITPALTGPSPRVGPPPGPVAVVYRVPVDAPVADPFRPPATPYGPGNRGIDFATTAGQPVLAMADGVVVFAGQVGGTLHVVVRHADGVRTSYSFLAVVLVSVGQPVLSGTPVGRAGIDVHVGARVGDEYIDPASLWSRADGRAAHAHLVPDDPDRPLGGPADERAALQGGLAGLPVRR
jgi:murein DD-endopeptidase MepM/ murein hydrolase activator NlpD